VTLYLPPGSNPYLLAAKRGWDFLTRALDKYGKDNFYQKCYFYGDTFNHNDELAWAAAAMFAAGYSDQNGAHDPHTLLLDWFPHPENKDGVPFSYACVGDDPSHNNSPCMSWYYAWWGMYEGYGCAIRDYAFAVRSGRRTGGLDPDYLSKCEAAVTTFGHIVRSWSENNAYRTDLPTSNFAGYGWNPQFYFPGKWTFDIAVADRIDMASDDHTRNTAAVLSSLNFESGCNPNNIGFLPGLGWHRQRVVVNQYWYNAGRVLPPTGNPIGSVNHFQDPPSATLNTIFYPASQDNTAGFALYDRWADAAISKGEFVGLQTARSLATAAWLAAQSQANREQPWGAADITAAAGSITPAITLVPNNAPQPVGLSSLLSLSQARIVWDRPGQQPAFSNPFSLEGRSTVGEDRVEAEAVLPDGRRVFASQSFILYDPIYGGDPFPSQPAPVALYHFDNSLADVEGHNLSGTPTYSGNVSWMRNPSGGGAVVRFAGLGDQLTASIPAIAFGTGTKFPLVIEFRIFARAFLAPDSGMANIVYLYQSDYAKLGLLYPAPYVGGTLVGFSNYQTVNAPLTLNAWHNVKITLTPAAAPATDASVSIVFDGSVSITATTTYHVPDTSTPWTLTIGNFNGDFDELRISNQ
jgi:hypothetical protein